MPCEGWLVYFQLGSTQMSHSMLIAFAMFAFVASITPGPNNLLLLSSGVNHGFRSSVPLLLGINIGFFVLLTAVGLGVSQLFAYLPVSFLFLKFTGAAYLIYLSWSLVSASTEPIAEATATKKPISFISAAAFQWVNPKAWVMATSAFSTYSHRSPSTIEVLTIALVFCIIGLPCIALWAAAGTRLRSVMRNSALHRLFNYGMAALLLASLYPMLSS